jgi:hypothetical protein
MNLTQFSRHARAYLDARVTVQLISAPGLGKSQTVEMLRDQYSKQDGFEWGLATILAAALTPPDVMGYLLPKASKMTHADGLVEDIMTSEFSMPPWLISDDGRPMNTFKRGMIFFDEWDKIDPDTRRCLANVILNGVAGRWVAHSGIGFVTAANRPEDRSGSTKEYDFIINRRAELHIRPDVKAWEDWAVRRNIPPLFIAFAVRNVEVAFSGKVPDKQGPYCTPRSLVMAANLMQHGGFIDPRTSQFVGLDDESTETVINEMLSGLIGPPATNALLTWARMKTEVPEFDEIVKDPKGAFIPDRPDAKMLVAYDMAHRTDVGNAGKVIDYVLRLPREFQIVYGLAAIKRNTKLIMSKAFLEKFLPENQGIITLCHAS